MYVIIMKKLYKFKLNKQIVLSLACLIIISIVSIYSASNMVNDFSNIEEFVVWLFVTYDAKNDVYKVNIRSRGPVINKLAAKYNGGGHIYSSGARVKTKEELNNLIVDYDNLCKDYLKNN